MVPIVWLAVTGLLARIALRAVLSCMRRISIGWAVVGHRLVTRRRRLWIDVDRRSVAFSAVWRAVLARLRLRLMARLATRHDRNKSSRLTSEKERDRQEDSSHLLRKHRRLFAHSIESGLMVSMPPASRENRRERTTGVVLTVPRIRVIHHNLLESMRRQFCNVEMDARATEDSQRFTKPD